MEFFEDDFDPQEDKRIGNEVSLDTIIKQQNEGTLNQGYDECQEIYILYKVCQLLANIHSNNQNHGSIRLSNILLDERYSPRVTKSTENSTQNESIEYIVSLSPETIFKQEHTAESDIYSFGIMILQVLTRQINIFSEYSNDIYVIKELIKNGVKPSVTSEKIPLKLTNILYLCFSQNKTKRPSTKMIQSILAKILTEKRYERQIQEIKNEKHKKNSKKRLLTLNEDITHYQRSPTNYQRSPTNYQRLPALSKSMNPNFKFNMLDILSNILGTKIYSNEQMNKDTPINILLGDNKYEICKEEDINTIMQQCNVTRDHAISALQEANGDLVTAVMNLAL